MILSDLTTRLLGILFLTRKTYAPENQQKIAFALVWDESKEKSIVQLLYVAIKSAETCWHKKI